jgi:serine/threonine-protein kinase
MEVHRVEPDTIIDGRYRVLKRLGSGGMADVYLVEDQQLGRRVALKLLYRRFAEDEQFVERFRREASSAAGLQHPNIVAIYDRGEWDGTYYIAMEYLEGKTLKQLVREHGPMPPEAAIGVAIQILRAARFAHKRGIVHRDLKPHNVMLDEEGRAKVTDFGIARAGASDMTETGSIMGTAHYLSPEQAQGQPVDARADIYSIGVVLYELLTGRVPFDAESAVTIALKHVSEPPVPPSELNPAVSPGLESVVLRAMEKDPRARFADADEFIAALEDVRAGREVVVERYPMPDEPFVDEQRKSRWWLWLLVALALVLIGVGLWLALRPQKIEVPDVVGDRSATAAQRLHNAGFEVDIETVVNPDVERDRVSTQDPSPGEEADEGSTVSITVSAGPGEAAVPAVVGERQSAAEDALREAGFEPRVRKEASSDVPSGRVISVSPQEGTTAERGSTVTLTVSSGPEQVEVPDVTGVSEDEARNRLEEAGLRVETQERETADEDPGTVLEQDPAAGTAVDAGSAVTLTLAKAPPDVAVPDLLNQTEADARTALEDAGFEVRRVRQVVTDPNQVGRVIDQSPDPGEQRPRGSRVTITVGRAAAPSPTPSPSPTPMP